MSKGKILVVDPDFDIRNMLDIYFTSHGYEVTTAENGATATATLSTATVPDVVIVEESLPDMDGRALVQALWQKVYMDPRPPVIYMSKTLRPDRIGSFFDFDDYVTKPFDVEELLLRVKNIIWREIQSMANSVTNRPRSELVEAYMREMIQHTNEWAYVEIEILNFNDFNRVYGSQAGEEVLRALSLYMGFVVGAAGTKYDFIGHPHTNRFCLVTQSEVYEDMLYTIAQDFEDIVVQHYARQRFQGKRVPMMCLEWGVCDLRTATLKDVRKIVEIARDELKERLAQYQNDNKLNEIWMTRR